MEWNGQYKSYWQPIAFWNVLKKTILKKRTPKLDAVFLLVKKFQRVLWAYLFRTCGLVPEVLKASVDDC